VNKLPPSICIVTPCYNEAEGIVSFYDAVVRALDGLDWSLVCVDDGSTDGTLRQLNDLARRDHRVRVFSLSRNFGHQIALSAGLDVADGDAVVILDSDLQHPPSLIPEMVRLWQVEGHDIVSAVRTSTAGASWLKRASADGFYWLINKLSDTPIINGAADFCLLSRRAHHALLAMPERHRFLRGMVAWIGFSRATVSFEAPRRPTGRPKYTAFRSLALAWDAILSFSSTPMRLATRLGVGVSGVGALYLLYIVIRYLALNDLQRGWGSLMAAVLVLGGMQLTFVGLMGEYVVRVFEESKRRPLYFFKQDPRTGPPTPAAEARMVGDREQ
jgi:polyisoprenyl-phosphate glycosyltransferase